MVTPQVNAVSILTKFLQTREKEEVGQCYATSKNQPENLINEALFLSAINSVKLKRYEEPNNL